MHTNTPPSRLFWYTQKNFLSSLLVMLIVDCLISTQYFSFFYIWLPLCYYFSDNVIVVKD